MIRRVALRWFLAAAMLAGFAASSITAGPQSAAIVKAQRPKTPRLYVFDCGVLHNPDMGRFSLKKEDVDTTDMSVACFLVVHPKGTLLWDAGAVPDGIWKPNGSMLTVHLKLPDGQEREVDVDKPLLSQLAQIGYPPSEVKYIALSHYHYDHTANANAFSASTWLVRQVERDAMFGGKYSGSLQPSSFSELKNSKTIIIKTDEYDVFGDGKVLIKAAPGHTQGHQVLYVNLAKTGPVLLSGDLYHYPAERALDRVPTFDFSQDQTRASRAVIEAFLKKTGAQLWIQHDFMGNAKLKKSPEYYE